MAMTIIYVFIIDTNIWIKTYSKIHFLVESFNGNIIK